MTTILDEILTRTAFNKGLVKESLSFGPLESRGYTLKRDLSPSEQVVVPILHKTMGEIDAIVVWTVGNVVDVREDF